ncbi:MAG: MFS transporter [Acidobacteria bacterium]|nr:MFS transporter [Acidobacteriota bacterium]
MASTLLNPERSLRYSGWAVVLAAFFGVMFSFAAIVPFTFSLFIAPLHAAFGWKREAISSTFGIAAMTVAVFSPGIGMLLDRVPPRRVVLPCIVVFSGALLSLGRLTPQLGRFYLTYFIIGVVGNGTAQLSYSRAVLSWFRTMRGTALALMLTGSGVGSILLPLIAQHVIQTRGWRAGYLTLGLLALLGFPLTAAFLRNMPGRTSHPVEQKQTTDLSSVFRSATFWLIAGSILLGAFGANGVLSHLAALLSERGVSGSNTALALSCLGAAGIGGRLLTGWLLDRFHAPTLSFLMFLLAAAGITLFAYATNAAMGIAGALLLGFSMGSEGDVGPYLIARYFGQSRFATLYGLTWTAYAMGGAVGPVLTGRLYDQMGGYRPAAILILSVTAVIAAFMNFALPRYSTEEAELNTITLESTAVE